MTTTAEETFAAHRGLLVAVAYRMLGSLAEAEDVVQEVWLRWQRVDVTTVDDPRAYLVTVVSRGAIDALRAAQVRRAAYEGPWLPEPLPTRADPAESAELAESVSMALLVVLETLSPLERAAFVLREAFGFDYAALGVALGRSEQACRQLAHRARQHVEARRPRFEPDPVRRAAVTERFLAACAGGDLRRLVEVLASDAVLESDGGGAVRAARRPIHGADPVARFLLGLLARPQATGLTLHRLELNGAPGRCSPTGARRPWPQCWRSPTTAWPRCVWW